MGISRGLLPPRALYKEDGWQKLVEADGEARLTVLSF